MSVSGAAKFHKNIQQAIYMCLFYIDRLWQIYLDSNCLPIPSFLSKQSLILRQACNDVRIQED